MIFINELLFIFQIFLTLLPSFYLLNRGFDEALYILFGSYIFFANFLVMKEIELFGIYTTPVEPFAISLFVLGNYIHEKRDARKAFKFLYMSWLTFFFLVVLYGTCIWHTPSLTDSFHALYNSLWEIFSRATFYSLFSCLISFGIERSVYSLMKMFGYQMLFSSIVSLLFSQLVDTTIFSFLVFDRPFKHIIHIIVFSMAIKLIYVMFSLFWQGNLLKQSRLKK